MQENDKCMIEYEKDIVIHGNYSEKNTPSHPGEQRKKPEALRKNDKNWKRYVKFLLTTTTGYV